MSLSNRTDLASLSEGMGFLLRRPFAALGLGFLGMFLGALTPFLQIRAALPATLTVQFALGFVCLLPLEMYFLPRFLAEADAAAGDRPLNPSETWEQAFDARWRPAMAGRLLLYAAILAGMICYLLPGLMILFAFSWTPLRMLLRGEPLPVAARGSLAMMARSWRRILGAILAIAALDLLYLALASFPLQSLGPDPTPWAQLKHPGFWVFNFLGMLVNLWNSAALLALFRRTEGIPDPPLVH